MPNQHEGVKPEHQTRAQMEVHPSEHGVEDDAPWVQSSNNQAPPPRPGMGQRWLRVSIRGEDDIKNVATALREGWTPRKWDDVSEAFRPMKIDAGRWTGCIGGHDSILFEIPIARAIARDKFMEDKTDLMTRAINYDLARDFKEVPLVEKKMDTKVAVGRRVPRVSET